MFQFLTLSVTLQRMAAAVQAACASLVDITIGSPLLAVLEAYAAVGLWLQWLILLLLARTRLATSNGADVDSFVNDFFLTRLPAVASSGAVTLTSLSTTSNRLAVPGASVKTNDGTATFTIATDTANAAWSPSQGGYVLPIGTASVNVPIVCTVAGVVGNVQAGAIGLLASAIPGVDLVTNAVPFTNGMDAETDVALRARFQLYIQSLSEGTVAAIIFAAKSVQQNVTAVVVENAPGTGMLTVYADDGSGSPSSSLLASITAAVTAVRPATIQTLVLGPSINGVSINVTLKVTSETLRSAAIGAAATAIATYVNSGATGAGLAYLNLPQIIIDSSPAITGLSTLTVNGGATDIAGAVGVVIKVTTLTVA